MGTALILGTFLVLVCRSTSVFDWLWCGLWLEATLTKLTLTADTAKVFVRALREIRKYRVKMD